MNGLTLIKKDGRGYVDSREVAEVVGKRHHHLLRDISGYIKIMRESIETKIGFNDFFLESSYVDIIGRTLPCYLLSKMGCEMVANKLTGEKGILFTAAYVTKFNEMEAAEREAEIKSHARPRLSEFNSAVRNVLNGMSYCCALPGRVMGFLRGVYQPLGIEVQDDTEDARYFSATEIARILRLYSDTGKPHAHAVGAIISKLDNVESHSIAVPFGLVGVMIRYDWSVLERVRDWLEANGNPNEIPHLGFYYHVYRFRQVSLFEEDAAFDPAYRHVH